MSIGTTTPELLSAPHGARVTSVWTVQSVRENNRPARIKHFPALTGLRFVLALWVIIHHLVGPEMMLEPIVSGLPVRLQALVRGGWVSVQAFFILSGLVLAHTYGNTVWTRRSLIRYGIARVARVYPGYLLSLVVVSPFIFYTLVHGTGRDWAPAHKAMLLANYTFVLQGWSGPLNVGWNTPAWSLSCEFLFYLCFPLVAWCVGKWSFEKRTAVTLTFAALLPAVLVWMMVPETWKPIHHLADFLTGIAAAGILHKLRLKSGVWLYVPAALLFAAVVAFAPMVEQYVVLNSALRPIATILLVGLAVGGGVPAALLSTRLVKFLGQASFSMYILHIPLLWWFTRYGVAAYFHMPPGVAVTVYLTGVIGLSAAAFHFVEEPANKAIRGLQPR